MIHVADAKQLQLLSKKFKFSIIEPKLVMFNPSIQDYHPKIGDKVRIVIKPYRELSKIGTIFEILTKKHGHSHGYKVKLKDGTVGRIVEHMPK